MSGSFLHQDAERLAEVRRVRQGLPLPHPRRRHGGQGLAGLHRLGHPARQASVLCAQGDGREPGRLGILFVASGRNLWAVILCHGLYDTIAFIRFANRQSRYSHFDQGQLN